MTLVYLRDRPFLLLKCLYAFNVLFVQENIVTEIKTNHGASPG